MKLRSTGHQMPVEAIGITMGQDGSDDPPTPAEVVPTRAMRTREDATRLRLLVGEHLDFAWRSLRRLGLSGASADDAVQRVFLVLSERLADVRQGSERAFLFRTAMHVASSERRALARRREVLLGDATAEAPDTAPRADDQIVTHQERRVLEELLQEMAMDVRAVFVLFELEELSTAEIAATLEIPMGTVSSRLRRAREQFHAAAKRYQARARAWQEGRR